MKLKTKSHFTKEIFWNAWVQSFVKLNPRTQIRNPVMFTVWVGSILTTVFWIASLFGVSDSNAGSGFIFWVAVWLWFTVLLSNFSEALAEGRGKAQAAELRKTRNEVKAYRLKTPDWNAVQESVGSSALRKDDVFLVEAGSFIPADGEILAGVASVDESAVTGESAPVIREAGGDRSSVNGGTRVLSDRLIVRVSSDPGQGFLDRMIALVEGTSRKKTPNEIALTILLAALTLILLIVTATLLPFSQYTVTQSGAGKAVSIASLVALFVCLAPTTIGALLSTIGIAGMNRLSGVNVLATSGRAVEAAGDVDVLLLDKTGTITLGNRMASEFIVAPSVEPTELALGGYLASWADETPEGRSILSLAKRQFQIPSPSFEGKNHKAIPFTARTRMSGLDWNGKSYRKGATASVQVWIEAQGGQFPEQVKTQAEASARKGSTPLVICENARVLGIVVLKDIVKDGIQERFAALRQMGIKTLMITGDNPLTAATIAAEAGVDDYLAEAKPEDKLALIRKYQSEGHLVAMTGDGTNDAPALAQADVAVAMNSGTQAAKEAGNMVDLDSNPTKLTEVVLVGKQMLITRGSLTTFSIANDVAKYFAILPALFLVTYPGLAALNVMHLATPESAILSAVIFNALIIPALIPLALKGVVYKAQSAIQLLRKNLVLYGLGGLLLPFVGIKLIDILLTGKVF
ncbi:MAG: potassium-transporting ATPase subunit KdpB [Spirochaetales bacterium]|nr:potassium-transporting ATPase subunit KdpB [Spirochaetales bacterium]